MSSIMILDHENSVDVKFIRCTDGRKVAAIIFSRISGDNWTINVLQVNASHKAYRGFGRYFQSWDEALNSYKSSFMKSFIALAKSEFTKHRIHN
jgi:hypothetical protein